VAFTIKELREMLALPDCVTVCSQQDFETVRPAVPSEYITMDSPMMCHVISKGCVFSVKSSRSFCLVALLSVCQLLKQHHIINRSNQGE
jgi:hypothetical protein